MISRKIFPSMSITDVVLRELAADGTVTIRSNHATYISFEGKLDCLLKTRNISFKQYYEPMSLITARRGL